MQHKAFTWHVQTADELRISDLSISSSNVCGCVSEVPPVSASSWCWRHNGASWLQTHLGLEILPLLLPGGLLLLHNHDL